MFPPAITNLQLQQLSEGLAALDGISTKPGEFEPFVFDTDTTWDIAGNQTLVTDKLRVFDRARKLLAAQHKIVDRMAVTPDNAASVDQFVQGLDELQNREVVIDGLVSLSREKLNVGHDAKKQQNRIPPSALAKLAPLLED